MKQKHDQRINPYIIVGVISILLLGGIVYASNNTKDSSDRGSGATHSTEPSTKRAAPNFTLNQLGGGTIELANYKGQKPVVLDFFATWCPNCRRDMPNLSSLYEKYKDRVEIIGVDLQEQDALVAKYVSDLGITFPIALDTAGKVSQQYGVRYTNFHVLIDKDGNVVGSVPGDISEEDIVALIGK